MNLHKTFADKKVVITGHTGFKGSWLSIWLRMLGAKVIGYGLGPYTNNDNYVVSDLKNKMINIIDKRTTISFIISKCSQYFSPSEFS